MKKIGLICAALLTCGSLAECAKKIKGAKVGHTISVDGYLNGKGNVNMGDKASPYQGKKCVLFMTD